MGAAPGEEKTANRRATATARQAGPQIHAMLDLEEAGLAFGIHVIRDRGSSQTDGMLKNLAQGRAEAFELGPGEAAGHTAGTYTRAKQALVGIDVSHTCQQGLVQKRSFDGETATPEKSYEGLRGNVEGFRSRTEEGVLTIKVLERQPTEAARVHEAKLEAGGEGEARVGVGGEGGGWVGDEQAASHSKVDDPLSIGILGRNWSFG